jgi:hypothetical protein
MLPTSAIRDEREGSDRSSKTRLGLLQIVILVCIGFSTCGTLLTQHKIFESTDDLTLLVGARAMLTDFKVAQNSISASDTTGINPSTSSFNTTSPLYSVSPLLCGECLQIVQYAPRVKLAKTGFTDSSPPTQKRYYTLKEAGKHLFQGALDAQGRSGFHYDGTRPPS